MPEAINDFARDAMAELARNEDQLAAMVRFVGDEVVQEVYEVRREVLPVRWRHRSAVLGAESNQRDNSFTAARECARQR